MPSPTKEEQLDGRNIQEQCRGIRRIKKTFTDPVQEHRREFICEERVRRIRVIMNIQFHRRVIWAIIQTHEQVSAIQGITKSADIRTVHRIHDCETGKRKELKHQSPHSFLQESFLSVC